jgi:WD40 repeat protein
MNGSIRLTIMFWALIASTYCQIAVAQSLSREPQIVVDAQGFTTPIHCMALSRDGRWLAAAADKVVRIWDLRTNSLHATLRGYQEPYGYHVGYVDSMVFSIDSRYLVVGVSDNYEEGSTRVYDMQNPTELRQLIKGHLGCTRGVAFSNSGNLLVTWGCDGNIIIYNWDGIKCEANELKRESWSAYPLVSRGSTPFQFIQDDRFLLFHQMQRQFLVKVDDKPWRPASIDDPFGALQLRRQLDAVKAPGSIPPIYLHSQYSVPASTVDSEKPWLVSAAREREVGERNFWAASWLPNGNIKVLHEHSFRVVATAWNSVRQVAASADLLGHVDVWSSEDPDAVTVKMEAENQRIWNVQWSSDGRSVQFSTESHPQSLYTQNNFGGIARELNLDRTSLGQFEGPVERRASSFSIKTPDGIANLERGTATDYTDLMIKNSGGEPYFVNMWAGVEAEGNSYAARKKRIDNYSIRLPGNFGEICFFSKISYSGCVRDDLFLLGSIKGNLVEGHFEAVADHVEFRINKRYLGHSSMITGADVSPDGTRLSTSSLDGTIRIWALKPAVARGDLEFYADGTSINAVPTGGESEKAGLLAKDVVQFVGDSTFYERIRLIQGGQLNSGETVNVTVSRPDSTGQRRRITLPVKLSDTPDVIEPTLSFFLSKDNEWVIWNQAGHYDSSSNGAKYVGWHVNDERHKPAKFYTSDQFQTHLYQPEIVRQTFKLGDPQKAVDFLKPQLGVVAGGKLGLPVNEAVEFQKYVPPSVSFITPATNANIEGDTVTIKAKVTMPEGTDFREAKLLIDGKHHPVRMTPMAETAGVSTGEVWLEEELALKPGKHKVKLLVVSSKESTGSGEVEFEIRNKQVGDPPKSLARGRLFVLAIGISDYSDPTMKLDYASKDAKAFSEIWAQRKGEAFTEVVTREILDIDATVDNVKESGFDWLLEQEFTPDDTVIVFLAGHAFFDRHDAWHFGCHELKLTRLSTTCISEADLSAFFGKLPANTILFNDSCHSGAFELPENVRRNPRTGKSIWREEGRIAFSSCRPQEVSLESSTWEHGAFTKVLLEYFQDPGSDLNKDGLLTCTEMFLYVPSRVTKMTNGAQTPLHEFSSMSDVVLGRANKSDR